MFIIFVDVLEVSILLGGNSLHSKYNLRNINKFYSMVIEQSDREVSEKLRYSYAKIDVLKLKLIYEKYNKVKKEKCNCKNIVERKIYRKMFYEWFDSLK